MSLDAARDARPATATSVVPADADVIEGEIVRVDQIGSIEPGDWLADLAVRAGERRPIVPPWLRSRREALATLRWVAGHYLHVARVSRLPRPQVRHQLAVRAPRGLARLVGGAVRWTFDLEGHPVRMATVARADPEAYLKLSRQRDSRVRLRVWVTGLATLILLAGAALAVAGPPPARWAALAPAVAVLGILGAPADRPMIDRAVVGLVREKLTSDIVIRALAALGIAAIARPSAATPATRSTSRPRSPATALADALMWTCPMA